MSNHHFKNREMTLKAKGLLSQMLSLPADWNYTIEGLASIYEESFSCISDTLSELEKFGHVKRQRIRDEKGMLRETHYDIYEEPIIENIRLDNPEQDNFRQGKQALLNTNKQITKEDNTNDINNSSNPIPSYNPSLNEDTAVISDLGRERKG